MRVALLHITDRYPHRYFRRIAPACLGVQTMNIPLLTKQGLGLATFGLRLAPWAVPLGAIGGWLVYPALTEDFKGQVGLPKEADPVAEVNATSMISFKREEIGGIPVKK